MRHLTAKREFRAPMGSASQASAAAGSSSRWETALGTVPGIAEGNNRVKIHCGKKFGDKKPDGGTTNK